LDHVPKHAGSELSWAASSSKRFKGVSLGPHIISKSSSVASQNPTAIVTKSSSVFPFLHIISAKAK